MFDRIFAPAPDARLLHRLIHNVNNGHAAGTEPDDLSRMGTMAHIFACMTGAIPAAVKLPGENPLFGAIVSVWAYHKHIAPVHGISHLPGTLYISAASDHRVYKVDARTREARPYGLLTPQPGDERSATLWVGSLALGILPLSMKLKGAQSA